MTQDGVTAIATRGGQIIGHVVGANAGVSGSAGGTGGSISATVTNGVDESYIPVKPPRDKEYNPLSIPNLQKQIRAWAIRKGWRNTGHLTRSFGDDMALIVSEVSEALEAFRLFGRTNDRWVTYTVQVEHPALGFVKFKDMTREQLMVLLDCDTEEELDDMIEDLGLDAKPEGVASELADVAIRLFDVCEQYEINLEAEIDYKMKHNDTRAYKHGGKHL